MKAIIYREFGSPDALRVQDVDKPVPGAGEVLVAVRAAGVNMFDWYMVRGKPSVFRLILGPQPKPLGVDLAGVVESVGSGVTRFKPGDHVYGTGRNKSMRPKTGSFAQFVCVAENLVTAKPRNVTFEQAAAVPVAGLTALQALRNHGMLKQGEKVLVNGASGGIGTFAVQIAKALGAEVTGVCSTRNAEMVRRIGADHVIDYTRQSFTDGATRYDIILDIVGNKPWSECRRMLTANGRYIIAGGPPKRAIPLLALEPFTKGKLKTFVARANVGDLNTMREMIEAGDITPVIDRTYSLSETAEAVRYVAAGHTRGKVVITIAS